jgi:hypothetical protein
MSINHIGNLKQNNPKSHLLPWLSIPLVNTTVSRSIFDNLDS